MISRAIHILRKGGLVAFPTETVYGLGADATSAAAVSRVFTVKGRPANNPLIVHVADAVVARRFAADWPVAAALLAERFWPGPLTLVLPKRAVIVDEATAGLPTVGLRAPDHPMTLQLLREFAGPMVGPSANRSNHVSPTTAQHVRDDLGDKVDVILDGGPCRVGIESTVLDLSTTPPVLRRLGAIARAQIEELIGPIAIQTLAASRDTAAPSPGLQPIHYAPVAPAWHTEHVDHVRQWSRTHPSEPVAMLLISPPAFTPPAAHRLLPMPRDPAAYAQRLYAALREADAPGVTAIWIELPPDAPEWSAIRDRLQRAALAAP